MSANEIQQLVQLSPYGLLIVAIGVLWRSYNAAQNARVDDLKTVISDLSSRVRMIEDKLGVKPPLTTATFDKPDVP